MGLLVEVENTRLEAAEGQKAKVRRARGRERVGIRDPRHAEQFIRE
ncbi:MAG: hypothetical protein NT047_10775 [Deltaproteobacteria bacterium]|nr:hypothetical protein [Deltaproteobacteria bacterium]